MRPQPSQLVDLANAGRQPPDPRGLKVHRTPPKRDVPYVPTDAPVVEAMLHLAQVGPNDVVYDLGCGDGRIVLEAARLCGAQGVGVDIDPLRIQESRDNAGKAGLGRSVQFVCRSFFEMDLRPATVVMLYLLPGLNVKLRPKLMSELRPGARIISNNFPMGDWPADKTLSVHCRHLYLWIVPAWVGGTWKCVLNGPAHRHHMTLQLWRHYQTVGGMARIQGREYPVVEGRLEGDLMSFRLHECRGVMRYTGRVEGTSLRGVCQAVGETGPAMPWGGAWVPGSSQPRGQRSR